MDNSERAALITRRVDEMIGADELPGLLNQNIPLRHYIGFEISGRLHLGTGLVCMQKIRDLQRAGVRSTVFLADWHTWINDKLGGNREVIQRTAVGYFKEGLRASLKAIGGDPDALDFVLGTELYHGNDDYWATLVEVSKNTTLARILRSVSIMGRNEGDSIDFAKLMYPPMQVADIFMLGANIAQGGMDQRKAHVIARDVALQMTVKPLHDAAGKVIKPIALHHHLLLGLQKPDVWPVPADQLRDLWTSMKMSKSKPNTAVFIHDEPDAIRQKIRKAFCPPGETEFNPILDWAKHLLFYNDWPVLEVTRTPENGGNVSFDTHEALCEAYKSGALHPSDLKNAVADAIIALLAPVREHFAGEDVKRMWTELEALL